jgi:RHS repeat-associated protein
MLFRLKSQAKGTMKAGSVTQILTRPFFLRIGLVPAFAKPVKLLSICGCALIMAAEGYSDLALTSVASPPASGVHVNRTVPNVAPPMTVLEFSANPAEDEFFRARVFAEPLVPIGGRPTAAENADLAAALLSYAKRSGPDDFASLTTFLDQHPQSPWAASVLTGLGIEYYNTAHYSLALDAWTKVLPLGKGVRDARGKALCERAFAELAYLDARLGRMTELEALLKPLNGRKLAGSAGEKANGAREGLWMMQNKPEVSFRCGPLALLRIKLATDTKHPATEEIMKSASTQQGFSLPQVAELSQKVGLNYQMAFRETSGDFVVPSVIHWKVGHYAALIKQIGDQYLVQDPTFRNDVWATRKALEDETSGYFLVPSGALPQGWRAVATSEGNSVWGKGNTSGNDPGPIGPNDLKSQLIPCAGMMVPAVHLMDVNLSLADQPVGYTPPVGPPVHFTVRYNSRDMFQPANFVTGNFGALWTCDYFSYINDNPGSPLADVHYYIGGGGDRTFTGFNTNTQSFAYQQYDETLLTRNSSNSYTMLWPDGSQLIFGQPDGSVGTSRNVYLTQIVDPQGNAVTLTYDTNLLLVAITDAIGQVTTLTYGVSATNNVAADPYKITKVTDPFGRSAIFNYTPVLAESLYAYTASPPTYSYYYAWDLASTTDEIGITSTVGYSSEITDQYVLGAYIYSSFSSPVFALTTPYGTNSFAEGDSGTTRFLETRYPDGSRDRVEYNQTIMVQSNGLPMSDPLATVPAGMGTFDQNLDYRNTYYWSRSACASSYGDYSKAKVFHWLHTADLSTTSGILESTKEALENRVWYDYAGQAASYQVGNNNLPAHEGRVLDDGSTQLYTQAYNPLGHLTNSIDPLGRAFSYFYDTNGIDLLEIRQTRAGQNDSLFKAAYNPQHRPLVISDAAGQTNTLTYNARGQILTATDPKNETTKFTYDTNSYLVAIDGPLPGTNDTIKATYDAYGRVRTTTDVSGYTLVFDYDNLDRITQVTHPDATFERFTYDRLDRVAFQDRAGRQTLFNYDNMRQMTKQTDPLGRVTLLEWCQCGALKSVTDSMGRTTSWATDVEGRRIAKLYGDGSQITYLYENTSGRLKQIVDEKQQDTVYSYNLDNTLAYVSHGNTAVPTPNVSFTYDANYERVVSMKDGIGTTTYSYLPIYASPFLGAGRLARVGGPLANDTCTYAYDELGRVVQTSNDGDISTRMFDAAGRISGASNALGAFTYSYDGSSTRLVSETCPNGPTASIGYGNNLLDFACQQITNAVGATPTSKFSYSHDIPRSQITDWSQQAGAQSPDLFSFAYDAGNQLLSATVTNSGVLVNTFAYSYDTVGNRLTELAGGRTATSTYNALNQLSSRANVAINSRTNEWDGLNRLTAVNSGTSRTEFAYDGMDRVAYIRQLQNGSETSFRRFVWCEGRICEERDRSGANVTKRFYGQGVTLETGSAAGFYYYTRDHLGSIRELTDAGGNVRARYAYDPYGRRTKVGGDLDADFGFAGMFWSSEASLALTHFRAYDPELGRWLSRDPLKNAEVNQGPNLYAYVGNNPVNQTDSSGLLWWTDLPEWAYHRLTWWTDDDKDSVFTDELLNSTRMDLRARTEEDDTHDLTGDLLGFFADSESLLGPTLDLLVETGNLNFVPIWEGPELTYPGVAGPISLFVGAGITILTMTDCNTANGIVGLVRQGKGGMLNAYADQQMKYLDQNP